MKYFVSYNYKSDDKTFYGFGNAVVKCKYKLKNIEDFRRMQESINLSQSIENAIIMYWKKI